MFDPEGPTLTRSQPLVLRAEDLPEPGESGTSRMWRRLDAALVYDSRLQPLPVGVRSGVAGLPRLMFAARGTEIDLQIRPGAQPGQLRIVGYVLDEDLEPCAGSVVVASSGQTVRADLDNCGRFAIDGLAPGRHQIEVSLPLAAIGLPPIHI